MGYKIYILGVFFFFACLSLSYAENVWEEANEAYAHANWSQAEKLYQQALHEAGDISEIWTNLGNVYAQQGQWGAALHAYGHALILGGNSKKLTENFKTLSKTFGRSLELPVKGLWNMSVNTWSMLSLLGGIVLGGWLLLWGGSLFYEKKFFGNSIKWLSIFAFLWLVVTWNTFQLIQQAEQVVVISPTPLLLSPIPEAQVTAQLVPGDVLKTGENYANFIWLEMSDGHQGWAQKEKVRKICDGLNPIQNLKQD